MRSRRGDDTELRNSGRFLLYVEGARDRDILAVWCRRLAPRFAATLERSTVIMGGRQPARAVEHFRGTGGREAGKRGLVVLDRDHHGDAEDRLVAESGLDLFTWGRRHIESYMLVPAVVLRLFDGTHDALRVERLLEAQLPAADDESAFQRINAKHLLGNKGPLARELGRVVTPGEIARSMRVGEFHADVVALFDRIRGALGERTDEPEVIRRPATR